jgi:hypothetical protein
MLVWVVAEIHQQRCATARQRYFVLSVAIRRMARARMPCHLASWIQAPQTRGLGATRQLASGQLFETASFR